MTNFQDCKTLAEVKAEWRRVRSKHHPDKGGHAGAFDQLSKDYHRALTRVRRAKCENCTNGLVTFTKGFYQTSVKCGVCKGTGKAT